MKSNASPPTSQHDEEMELCVSLTEEQFQALQRQAHHDRVPIDQIVLDIISDHVRKNVRDRDRIVSRSFVSLTTGQATSTYGGVGGYSPRGFFMW